MACLDAELVTALFAGKVSREDREQIDAHVDGCTACRRWVANAARDHVGRETTADDVNGALDASSAETLPAAEATHVTLAPGTPVGRYIVQDFLGAGAMGVVYAAHDPQLDRPVALKVVRAGGERGQARAHRFVREAQAMARVSHPNVIPIYDAGQTDALVFIAMKRITGVSLREHLAREPSQRERLRLICGAGRGLAAAHAAGIVHRDFKPDNVLVDADGTAQVGDFGLAALTGGELDEPDLARGSEPGEAAPAGAADVAIGSGESWQTVAGTILGTPRYMAPEVQTGQRGDALSDQYSFAVTVGEVLGASRPRRIQRALQRALADEPSRRFPSIDRLVAALEQRLITLPTRSSSRAQIAGWIAAGALVVAAAVWIAWPSPAKSDPAVACDEAAGGRIEAVFGGAQRGTIAAHLASLPHLHARDATSTLERLDRYSTDWLAMRRATCRASASGELSPELYDLKMACLDERLDALGVVTRTLGALEDARADAAARVGNVLGELEQCANPKGLRVRTGSGAEEIERTRALRARLVEIHVLLQQGFFDRAMPAFDAVVAEARTHKLEVVEAEALMGRSVVLAQSRRAGGTEGFHQVLAIAERLGDAALRVDALGALLADSAVDRARATETELLVRLIETGLAELPGPQLMRRARVAGNLANYYLDKREFPAAERSAATAEKAFREDLGPLHPYTLMARSTQASIQSIQGHQDKAIAITSEMLAELRRAYGESHPLVAQNELSLGVWLGHAQRLAESSAAFERALAISERVYGPDDVHVAQVLRKVGFLALDRDPKRAREAFARAVAIFEAKTKPGSAELAPLLSGLGEAQLMTGEAASAVKTLERAFVVWGDSKVAAHLLPTARFALARALWESGGDRVRAKRLADEARAEFVANKGPWLPKADEVAAWLKTHR